MRASVFFTLLVYVALAASAPLTQHDLAAAKAAVNKCNADLDIIEAKLLQAYNTTRGQRGMLSLAVTDAEFVKWVSSNKIFDGKKRQCALNQARLKIVQAALDKESEPSQNPSQSGTTIIHTTSATASSTKIPTLPHGPTPADTAISSGGTKPTVTVSSSSTQSLPASGQTTPVAGGGAAPPANESSSPTKHHTTFPLTVPPMSPSTGVPVSPTQSATPESSSIHISYSNLCLGAALAVAFLMS